MVAGEGGRKWGRTHSGRGVLRSAHRKRPAPPTYPRSVSESSSLTTGMTCPGVGLPEGIGLKTEPGKPRSGQREGAFSYTLHLRAVRAFRLVTSKNAQAHQFEGRGPRPAQPALPRSSRILVRCLLRAAGRVPTALVLTMTFQWPSEYFWFPQRNCTIFPSKVKNVSALATARVDCFVQLRRCLLLSLRRQTLLQM